MAALDITTVEMHTAGEPLRILEAGIPPIRGATILDKRRYVRDNLDHIRKFVIFEPRGHYDMYGVIFVTPDKPDADMACLFIHNEGYSTMCGHAVISLGRYAVDKGLVKSPTSPETRVVIQCPCGPVEAFVEYSEGRTGTTRFNSVPAFLYKKDVVAEVPGYGRVTVDVSYGGAFYAIVPASRLSLDVRMSAVRELQQAAGAVTDVLRQSLQLSHPDNDDLAFLYGTILTDDILRQTLQLSHPDNDDLAFLYGTILTDGRDEYSDQETANICVFADKEVDRSPCGSGVTARIALQVARGLIMLNQTRTFVGPAGGRFKARAVRQSTCGPHEAVIVEVAGHGYYTGTSKFTFEDGDDIGKGFLLR